MGTVPTDVYGIGMLDPGYNQGGAPLQTSSLPQSGWDWSKLGQVGAGTYASAFATGLSFVGQLVAAKQAKNAAEYNAKVADANAQAAMMAAESEAQQHQRNAAIALNDIMLVHQSQQEQERQQRQRQEYIAGTTRALVGASGLLMRGSPLATYEFNLQESQRQILQGRYKADLEERALRDRATMETYAADVSRWGGAERLRVGGAQGALARYEGGTRQYAGMLGAFGSLAAGGARTYAAYEATQARRGQQVRDPGTWTGAP